MPHLKSINMRKEEKKFSKKKKRSSAREIQREREREREMTNLLRRGPHLFGHIVFEVSGRSASLAGFFPHRNRGTKTK
jgi:hypothetical protein